MYRAEARLFPLVLVLGRCFGLPLHVVRLVGAAVLQRLLVIDYPARTHTMRAAGTCAVTMC